MRLFGRLITVTSGIATVIFATLFFLYSDPITFQKAVIFGIWTIINLILDRGEE